MTIEEFNRAIYPLLPSPDARRIYRLWEVLDMALARLTPKERRELLGEFSKGVGRVAKKARLTAG